MPAGGEERRLGSRAPGFIKRSRPLHMTWQFGVLLVGIAVVAAGIAMLALPGPGWVAIFAGFAVLATEFIWAQRALIWARRQAARAAEKALDPKARRRNIILAVVALVLLAAAVGAYLWRYGLTLAPWIPFV
nr:TIGR02611 family protein [Allostreptomyces psammosilenae]